MQKQIVDIAVVNVKKHNQPLMKSQETLLRISNILRSEESSENVQLMRTAPKLVDPTTPGRSYEFPPPWIQWIEEHAMNGRVIK